MPTRFAYVKSRMCTTPYLWSTSDLLLLHAFLLLTCSLCLSASCFDDRLNVVFRLTGSTTFTSNYGLSGGAIYTDNGEEDGEAASTTTFPDDTTFIDNEAEVRVVRYARVGLLSHTLSVALAHTRGCNVKRRYRAAFTRCTARLTPQNLRWRTEIALLRSVRLRFVP